MAKKVSLQPALPRPSGSILPKSLADFDIVLVRALFDEFMGHAQRLNLAVTSDGQEKMSGPLVLAAYAVADLPPAASWEGGVVRVTDPSGGGQVLAYSDGSNWIRADNGSVVS